MSILIKRLLIVAFAAMTLLCVVSIKPVFAVPCAAILDENGNPLPEEWIPVEEPDGSALAP
jgi:hypothetical protein